MSEWADISGAALERDRLDYPHDEPCPQCGRRQWTAEHAPETCQACGYTVPRFCVETAGGWQHLISAEDATDAGLDVDRAYCPEHDAPLTEVPAPAVWAEPGPDGGVWVAPVADLGVCAYCQLPLVPGVGEEAEHPRSAGADGRLRYFCAASADALHKVARHM